jgi:putative phosphoribosyl transferase
VARRFADRRDAGRALARALLADGAGPDAVVLGLPRGGVVVAAEVAAALHAPLDVVVVRKLGLPGHAELAMGALATVGGEVETVRTAVAAEVDEPAFAAVRQREMAELLRRERDYRAGRPPVPLRGRAVLVVDDGLATGATVGAAVAAVARQAPSSVTVAVPVGSPRACSELAGRVDHLVCLESPRGFRAVGQAYRDFSATPEEAVRAALDARR